MHITKGKKIAIGVICGCLILAIVAATGVFHRHDYEERVIAPTCQKGGHTEYVCDCGDSYIDDRTEKTGHTFIDEVAVKAACLTNGFTNGTVCSYCGYVLVEQKVIIGNQEHKFSSDGKCIECGEKIDGTLFGGSKDDESLVCAVSVVKDYSKVELIIPKTIKTKSSISGQEENYVIKEILENAFMRCSNVKNITIGSGVEKIHQAVFENCTSLEKIAVDDDNEFFSNNSDFSLYNKNKTVLLCFPRNNAGSPQSAVQGVIEIGAYAFSNVTRLYKLKLEQCTTKIGNWAFNNCLSLNFIDASNVSEIGEQGFNKCGLLNSIVLKDGVIVGENAFNGCSKLSTVYYMGVEKPMMEQEQTDEPNGDNTEEEIIEQIAQGNENLLNAKWYFYSATEPTEEGDFWHYDEFGSPVIWGLEEDINTQK